MNKINKSKRISENNYKRIILSGAINLIIYYATVYYNYKNLFNNPAFPNTSTQINDEYLVWPGATLLIFTITLILTLFPSILIINNKTISKEKEVIQQTKTEMLHLIRNTLTSFLAVASWFLVYRHINDFKYSGIIFLSATICILYTFKEAFRLSKLKLDEKE